ncbi:MAG TPA: BTAD domain-containing putative transcriptional regulator [Miltoncostaea sp.]|nr:BTAD domain-containing putative transcriptional regulator [Miltoncostaea sp.]
MELCGRVVVRFGGARCDADLGPQARTLLVYLALRRHPATRDELVEALWPSGPPPASGAALSALLSRLRRALGPDRIEGRNELELALPSGCRVDVEEAMARVEVGRSEVGRGEWRRAYADAGVAWGISGRPLLAWHEAPWVDEWRRTLEEVNLRALECLSAASIGIGGSELEHGVTMARAGVSRAPLRERFHVLLMEGLAATGSRPEALAVYEALRCTLRDELGATPGPEARASHARILAEVA